MEGGLVERDTHDGEGPAAATASQIQAGEREQKIAKVAGAARRGRPGDGGAGGEQGSGGGELGGDVARGEQAMMADLDEALGQNVQHEAAEEFVGSQGHPSVAAGTEGDGALVEGDETVIGQAHPVGVSAEIAKDLVAVAEGRFAVHHPALVAELVTEVLEAVAVGGGRGGADEPELAEGVGAAQGSEHLAAEQGAEDAHRKEKVGRGGDPALAVARQAASGDDAVDVGVKAQVAPPGVQDAGDAEVGAEPLSSRPSSRSVSAPQAKSMSNTTSGLTMARRRSSRGRVNTTWNEGVGSMRSMRCSTQRACASPWHLGQCRLRHELYEGP
jgi:hypothetical protein